MRHLFFLKKKTIDRYTASNTNTEDIVSEGKNSALTQPTAC